MHSSSSISRSLQPNTNAISLATIQASHTAFLPDLLLPWFPDSLIPQVDWNWDFFWYSPPLFDGGGGCFTSLELRRFPHSYFSSEQLVCNHWYRYERRKRKIRIEKRRKWGCIPRFPVFPGSQVSLYVLSRPLFWIDDLESTFEQISTKIAAPKLSRHFAGAAEWVVISPSKPRIKGK
jgi:hypothetical protein